MHHDTKISSQSDRQTDRQTDQRMNTQAATLTSQTPSSYSYTHSLLLSGHVCVHGCLRAQMRDSTVCPSLRVYVCVCEGLPVCLSLWSHVDTQRETDGRSAAPTVGPPAPHSPTHSHSQPEGERKHTREHTPHVSHAMHSLLTMCPSLYKTVDHVQAWPHVCVTCSHICLSGCLPACLSGCLRQSG